MNPSFGDLIRAELAGADDLEVVLSVVELPPNMELPVHTHPGEEFAYVMEGSLVLWEQGKGDTVVRAGDSAKVPLGAYTPCEPRKRAARSSHSGGMPRANPSARSSTLRADGRERRGADTLRGTNPVRRPATATRSRAPAGQ